MHAIAILRLALFSESRGLIRREFGNLFFYGEIGGSNSWPSTPLTPLCEYLETNQLQPLVLTFFR